MSHWIISGASRGIGAALAAHLSSEYEVLGMARASENAENIKSKLEGTAGFQFSAVDLRDTEQTAKAVSGFLPRSPERVVLVNCAATWTGGKTTLELSAHDYIDAFTLNFLSAVNAARSTLDHWQVNGKYPLTIVNLGATASTRGGKKTSSFAVSKCALRVYSQSMAKELGPEGVHVCHLIIDGLIDNPRTRGLNEGRESKKYIRQEALIQTIVDLANQPLSCWTFELDLRPYNENW